MPQTRKTRRNGQEAAPAATIPGAAPPTRRAAKRAKTTAAQAPVQDDELDTFVTRLVANDNRAKVKEFVKALLQDKTPDEDLEPAYQEAGPSTRKTAGRRNNAARPPVDLSGSEYLAMLAALAWGVPGV
jgi:hypothetical protein